MPKNIEHVIQQYFLHFFIIYLLFSACDRSPLRFRIGFESRAAFIQITTESLTIMCRKCVHQARCILHMKTVLSRVHHTAIRIHMHQTVYQESSLYTHKLFIDESS